MLGSAKTVGIVTFGLIVLIAAGWWIFRTYFDTYHLAAIQEGAIYRDGVRSIQQFDLAARKTHIKTVICLVDDREINKSPFTDELAYCKTHKINLIRVPITLGGWPDGNQIQQFLSIATDPARQPVLVHCAQGVRRTGMMAAAYQRSILKWDKTKTTAALLTFGHSDRTVNDVKRFIEVYDPETRHMTESLPVSAE